jgi:hypothetical protein
MALVSARQFDDPRETDDEFIRRILYRVADAGGLDSARAYRVAQAYCFLSPREVQAATNWNCSPEHPCHHCIRCDPPKRGLYRVAE